MNPNFGAIALNLLLFQGAWFAAVLGAALGRPWTGVAAIAIICAWHLLRARRRVPEGLLLLFALLVGTAFETGLVRFAGLEFTGGMLAAGTAPLWMIALWAGFATTLNVSLRGLRTRPALAAALGALGAPAAYYAGHRLGAVGFADTAVALAAVAGGWLLLSPLLVLAARRLDGFASS